MKIRKPLFLLNSLTANVRENHMVAGDEDICSHENNERKWAEEIVEKIRCAVFVSPKQMSNC